MKLSKIISSGRALWQSIRGSQCNNDKNESRKLKEATGVGKKSLATDQVNILKKNQKNKHKNEMNKKQFKDNIDCNNGEKIGKISSRIIFRRKFSKYNDVGHKLDAKFKSSYKSSGQFDPSWTKYKAYVDKNQNRKNKSYLKHTMCSSGSYGDSKKKKRTLPCPDLPGKGTYNHRIAYDEALQLHRLGADVDVLYKVKNNKTDSIYVINGEFFREKNKRFNHSRKHKFASNHSMRKISQDKINDPDNGVTDEQQKYTEEEALWLAELAKARKDKETQKIRLANIAAIHREKMEKEKKEKLDKFHRNQKIREAEKKFRSEQLKRIAQAQELKRKKREQEDLNARKEEQLGVDTNGQNQNTDLQQQEQMDHRTKMIRLRRLKMQQNLLAYKKYKNSIGNPLDTKHANALGGNKEVPDLNVVVTAQNNNCHSMQVIVDPDIINDVERWALHNDGTLRAVSWLKIVSGRIDSLDGRVSQSYKNKWMRIAIDQVVDTMTTEQSSKVFSTHDMNCRKPMCKKISKVSSSFVIKTKRTAVRCRHNHNASVHKSPKFTGCPDRGTKMYELIKTNEGSYFQVISVDAFGLCGGVKELRTNNNNNNNC